ncbi:hypothetical protein DL237_12810 [Pseudooceanicola sediminis]|uniref:Uncharacterized protein n=1 Tax=Pseudooceanicola sediminis TaxID=2211117 RepID=A0A399IZK2_9RHOB|nr:hypothetical protein DL237_12810 [Pseudooceanicola sediminis]|tara:strand:- start:47139 stop:47348 length:210 start_codon:yes stop_codon:yes gene_type:complete
MQIGLLGLSLALVAMISGGFGLSSGWFGAPPPALTERSTHLPMASSKARLFEEGIALEAHLLQRDASAR